MTDAHKTNKKKKRLLIECVVVFLFITVAVLYIRNSGLLNELELVVNLRNKDLKPNTIRLYADQSPPVEVRLKNVRRTQSLHFPLPRQTIGNLRFSLGETPSLLALHSLEINGLFHSYRIDAQRMRKFFHLAGSSQLQAIKKKYYQLRTTVPHQELTVEDPFYKLLEKSRSYKGIYYLFALLTGLVLFFFIHYIDLRNLRVFFNKKHFAGGTALVLTIFFLLMLTNPVPRQEVSGEKRRMNINPRFRLDSPLDYARQYTPYYNDHFSFRTYMIFLGNYLKVKLLGVSPMEKVILGKEGWLFLGPQQEQTGTVDYYRNLDPFTPAQLETWKVRLEQRRNWLKQRGIHYLFMIVPNKNTIYPEYMPDHIRQAAGETRLMQLVRYLKEHSDLSLIDPRAALLEAKKNKLVYSITDTHWSPYGAYIGYLELIKKVKTLADFETVEALPLEDFTILEHDTVGGDLAQMLMLHKDVMRESVIRMKYKPGWRFSGGSLGEIIPFVRCGYTTIDKPYPSKVLMVHDSFYKRLKPFMSQTFSRIVYVWDWETRFFPRLIEKENPGLVIDEMAERFLMDPPPVNPENLGLLFDY